MIKKQSCLYPWLMLFAAAAAKGQFTFPGALTPTPKPAVALVADVTVTTTSVNGFGSMTQSQAGKYYRSSDWKTRQDSVASTTIIDPQGRTIVTLNHQRAEAVMTQLPPLSPAPSLQSSTRPTSPPSPAEDLGLKVISGYLAHGRRRTVPNPSGLKLGTLTTEVWTSSDLGLALVIKQTSLENETIQQFQNIQVGEPSRELFAIPASYVIRQSTQVPSSKPSVTPAN